MVHPSFFSPLQVHGLLEALMDPTELVDPTEMMDPTELVDPAELRVG